MTQDENVVRRIRDSRKGRAGGEKVMKKDENESTCPVFFHDTDRFCSGRETDS